MRHIIIVSIFPMFIPNYYLRTRGACGMKPWRHEAQHTVNRKNRIIVCVIASLEFAYTIFLYPVYSVCSNSFCINKYYGVCIQIYSGGRWNGNNEQQTAKLFNQSLCIFIKTIHWLQQQMLSKVWHL